MGLLWLAAVAPIQSLAWKLPYAAGMALKRKKKRRMLELSSVCGGVHLWGVSSGSRRRNMSMWEGGYVWGDKLERKYIKDNGSELSFLSLERGSYKYGREKTRMNHLVRTGTRCISGNS